MRISDWSSDVCSSDLGHRPRRHPLRGRLRPADPAEVVPPAPHELKGQEPAGKPGQQNGPLRGRLSKRLISRAKLERAMRFELTTPTLARLCSTPELRPDRKSTRLNSSHYCTSRMLSPP